MAYAHTHLAVIVMIRNQADILSAFLSHLRVLFDRMLVIDHVSTDGTREILKAARAGGHPVEIYSYSVRGHFQAALCSRFARKAFAEGADWVFFLDGDEFINVPDRAALLGLLSNCDAACAFVWRNLAPTRFGSFEAFDLGQDFFEAPQASRYVKVALSRAVLREAPLFCLEPGNHAVRAEPRGPHLPAPTVGELFHVPIRSFERLCMKVEAGVAALRAKSRNLGDEGFHWIELLGRVRSEVLDDTFLRKVALSYGERLDDIADLPADPAPRRIVLAGVTPGMSSRLARGLDDTTARETAVSWTRLRTEGDENVLVHIQEEHVTLSPRTVRADGTDGPERFAALPPDVTPLADDLWAQRMASALDLATRPIETLTPGAWSRLAPAIFALIALLRPRRFVELGSRYGLSFFATNQVMRTLDLAADSVAVDTWSGDPEAGHQGEKVFADFTHLLRTRYPERGFYIRGHFEDAVACFEDGSIDLLHIDDLHTHDAIRVDFETWLPKMSDRGVVLLHNTTAYEADFGVWQLWRELSARHPAANVLHGHGLGIVYVGSRPCRFSGALRDLAAYQRRYAALKALLPGVGDLALAAAEAKRDTAAREELAGEVAEARSSLESARTALDQAQAEAEAALQSARADLDKAQAELAALRSSTSWKLSASVRALGRVLHDGRHALISRSLRHHQPEGGSPEPRRSRAWSSWSCFGKVESS